jgi:RNA polymerase sigma-70 factor (ECF subfamily)
VADRDRLDRGFKRLTADQRAVLVLHHYLGLTPVDTAEVLGIPVGTVGSRLHYATKALRAAIESDEREVTTEGRTA